jgi:phenylpropionate dioxygenase-like ring-hydroxylating dioxygenase large terminal subunit
MIEHMERTLHGTPKILGRYSQFMHNNWKLYVENSRDNYHPSLLHAFFSTFKLNRLIKSPIPSRASSPASCCTRS